MWVPNAFIYINILKYRKVKNKKSQWNLSSTYSNNSEIDNGTKENHLRIYKNVAEEKTGTCYI